MPVSRNTPTEFVVLSRVVVFVLIVMPWWMGEGGMRVAGVCVEGCGEGVHVGKMFWKCFYKKGSPEADVGPCVLLLITFSL